MGVASQLIFFFVLGMTVLGILLVKQEPHKMLLALAVAITPWQGGLWIAELKMDFRFTYLLYFLVGILLLLKPNPHPLLKRIDLPIALPTAGLLLSASLATAYAIDAPSAWGGVVMMLINFIIFIVMINAIQKPSDLKYVFYALLASIIFQSVLGLIQYKFHSFRLGVIDQNQSFMWWRASGTFFHSNHFGMFLALTIPIIFRLYLLYDTHKEKRVKQFYLVGLFLGILSLLSTRNRGSWIGLVVGTIIVLFYDLAQNRSRMRKTYVKLIIPSTVIVFLITLRFGDMMMNRLFHDDADFQIQGRMALQDEAIGLIKANPLGVGLRNYRTRIPHEFVHNLYLLIASEAGIAGLGFFIIILIVLFFRIIRFSRVSVISINNLALAMMISFFAFIFASISGPDYLIDHSVGMTFWVMVGLLTALGRMSDRILHARLQQKRLGPCKVGST